MKKLRKIISGLLVLLIIVIIGCGKQITETEALIEISEEITTTEETIEETTEETTEEVTEETPEEEISEEEPVEIAGLSSCVILDEEYCDKGELICEDENILPIGFNLPVGIKIYAPFDGVVSISDYMLDNGQLSKAIGVLMWPQEEISTIFSFEDIAPNEALLDIERMVEIEIVEGSTTEFIQVKKGELIGYTTEGIPYAFMEKEYNFLITIFNSKDLLPYSKGQFVEDFTDLEYLHKFFPDIECGE